MATRPSVARSVTFRDEYDLPLESTLSPHSAEPASSACLEPVSLYDLQPTSTIRGGYDDLQNGVGDGVEMLPNEHESIDGLVDSIPRSHTKQRDNEIIN